MRTNGRPLRGAGRTSLFGLMGFLPCLLLATPAYAQDAAASPADATPPAPTGSAPAVQDASAPAPQSNGDIVVTGTRISGFTSPTPLTQVSQAELETKAVSTVADLLQDVPQLRMNQNIGKSSEPVGASNVDLRGLGSQRTLVLLNGKRLAFTDPAGTIDTNIIPVALIKSVDIVTGGASAAYGSDAVAGVVNFVLDDKFEGFKLDASYGETKYNDFRRPQIDGAYGKSFLDGRLHFTLAGDYMRNSGETAQGTRDWGNDNTALITNPAYTATNGEPRLFIANGSLFSQMTAGGALTRANGLTLANALGFVSGTGVQFDAHGKPVPFHYGTNIGGTYMTGGDGGSVSYDGNLLPRIERYGGYGRLSFDASDNVTFYGDMLFSQVNVLSDLSPNPDNGDITINADNAFLDSSVRDAMATAGLTSFKMGRMNYEDDNTIFHNRTRVFRWTFGAQGSFGDSWKWDVSGQIGRNSYRTAAENNRIQQRWNDGLDSVTNPATGQPICRVTLENPGANDTTDPYRDIRDCVPINPFGAGSISAAAVDYYRGTSVEEAHIDQDVYAANISGRPFSTWAGDVSVAAGAEYRRERTELTSDGNSALSRWRSINAQPFSGEFNVKEVYGEVVVPLARGAAWAKNLDFNGAVRYTDYSSSGGVATWKLGLNYSPADSIRFRGTVSRDIRAPNNYELYSRGNQVISGIIDPVDNTSRLTKQITSGNPDLKPEKADTRTVGVVWTPTFMSGFQASVDYYSIKLKDAITTIAPQSIVDFCNQGQTIYCSSVIRGSDGTISQINNVPFNASSLKTSGVDVEAQYHFGLGGGRMSLRGLVNYVDELSITANGVKTDYVGQEGASAPPEGLPRWRANADVNYALGPFQLDLSYRYIGGGKYDVRYNQTTLDLANNSIHGRSYVDIGASWQATHNVQLYTRIENLFDVDPPLAPTSITQPTIANSPFFDVRGTFAVFGVRLKL